MQINVSPGEAEDLRPAGSGETARRIGISECGAA
jgi:hypothetical protein